MTATGGRFLRCIPNRPRGDHLPNQFPVWRGQKRGPENGHELNCFTIARPQNGARKTGVNCAPKTVRIFNFLAKNNLDKPWRTTCQSPRQVVFSPGQSSVSIYGAIFGSIFSCCWARGHCSCGFLLSSGCVHHLPTRRCSLGRQQRNLNMQVCKGCMACICIQCAIAPCVRTKHPLVAGARPYDHSFCFFKQTNKQPK